jgi:glycosyltransferase involved in cell wall biosynthesis
VVLFPPARHPFLWFCWFEIAVARWLNNNKPDLFVSTDGYGSLRTDVKQLLVIHDLSFEHFPEYVPFWTKVYLKHFMPKYADKATRLATVSEFSKNDIAERYGVSLGNIDVVYNGAKEIYKPVSEAIKQAVRTNYTGGKEYYICVSSIHPRKNIKNLLLAFDKFKKESGSDFKLVIVGRKAWHFSDVEDAHAKMKFKQDVIFAGHVAPEDLGEILASAFAMIYVSLFEGFGIPIIEAMSCGVPVITSNVSSMPEAAGDAALLVNPNSVDEISSAMRNLVDEPTLRNVLIEQGSIQIKRFSWDLTADKLWDCCNRCLE